MKKNAREQASLQLQELTEWNRMIHKRHEAEQAKREHERAEREWLQYRDQSTAVAIGGVAAGLGGAALAMATGPIGWVGAATGVAGALVAGGGAWESTRAEEGRQIAEQNRKEAQEALDKATREAKEARDKYDSKISEMDRVAYRKTHEQHNLNMFVLPTKKFCCRVMTWVDCFRGNAQEQAAAQVPPAVQQRVGAEV